MEWLKNDVAIHFAEHGRGVPVVALHGAGVDHREIEGALEAAIPDGYRRIYPDLPGMGKSTAGRLTGNDDVVAVLTEFVGETVEEPAFLVGHSYGAYLARGLAAHRPDLVRGLALLCPLDEHTGAVPEHRALVEEPDAHDELDRAHHAGFDEYFVIRTRATARSYRDRVVPGTFLVDEESLGRIFERWSLDMGADPFSGPALIAAGRADSVVGYRGAIALLDRYPQATLVVVDDAGHALMHEQPDLLAALLRQWLHRSHGGRAARS